MSAVQRRQWLLGELAADPTQYNLSQVVEIRGRVDVRRLAAAVERVVERHDILRTTFSTRDEKMQQLVWTTMTPDLRVMSVAPGELVSRAIEVARRERAVEFDLAAGPLIRMALLIEGPERACLVCSLHHSITDLRSLRLLVKELAAAYEYLGQAPSAEPPAEELVQYADFAEWEGDAGVLEAQKEELAFWRSHLGDAEIQLDLPMAKRSKADALGKDQRSVHSDLIEKLKDLARQERTSLFCVGLAAYAVIIGVLAERRDAVVGTLVVDRPGVELQESLGFFVNTVLLRLRFCERGTFRQLTNEAQRVCESAFRNQRAPFDAVVDVVRRAGARVGSPASPIMFEVLDKRTEPYVVGEVAFQAGEIASQPAPVDLIATLVRHPDGYVSTWESNRYASEAISALHIRFLDMLEQAAEEPDEPLVPLARKVLNQFAAFPRPAAVRSTSVKVRTENALQQDLAARLSEMSSSRPDAVAVADCAGREVSYGELAERVEAVAAHLRGRGVGREVLVGICLARGVDLVVATLSVLVAGGAFLPLDPSYPVDRLEFMAGDAGIALLVTEAGVGMELKAECERMVLSECGERSDAAVPAEVEARDLAYVIYTSGSTGRPKGVMIEHQGLNNLMQAQSDLGIDAGDCVLQFASSGFDAFVSDLTAWLGAGARLQLLAPGGVPVGEELEASISEGGVSVAFLPPSVLATIRPERCGSLMKVMSVGEACPVPLARSWNAAGREVHNLYGPTEATVWTTGQRCTLGELTNASRVPIGRAIENVELFVLDESMERVALGASGELFIGGVGVARGYLRRPELTAERFIANPFDASGAGRLYRTGDLVCEVEPGVLEFLGRADLQVKFHGYRIELGEIEAVLAEFDCVRQCVAVLSGGGGEEHLVALVVPNKNAETSETAVTEFLSSRLPRYMVPSRIAIVPRLPLTPSGKVDRGAISVPAPVPRAGSTEGMTAVEAVLAEIWCEVLGLQAVGPDDDFFLLGGHSLLAAAVASRVEERLLCEVRIADFFENERLCDLAGVVEAAVENAGAARGRDGADERGRN